MWRRMLYGKWRSLPSGYEDTRIYEIKEWVEFKPGLVYSIPV
jgi:hypothetical protein